MRVLIAAGGTAGHINPALAIAGAIKKADPSADILKGNPRNQRARIPPIKDNGTVENTTSE